MDPDHPLSKTDGFKVKTAMDLFEDGEVTQAIEMLKPVAEKNPSKPVPNGLLGGCLNHRERHEEAIPYLARAAALSPLSQTAAMNYFLALYGTGRVEEAIAELDRYLTRREDPEVQQLLDTVRNLANTLLGGESLGGEVPS